MKPRYTSEELFHFVGHATPADDERNYDTLKKVLFSKWISHPPHNPGWGPEGITINADESLWKEGMVVPQVVCFCDIPIEALAIHVSKYGKFGLSVSRDYAQRYGARPVSYFPLHVDNPETRYGVPCLIDMGVVFRSLREHLKKVETPNERTWGQPLATLEHASDVFAGIVLKEFLAYLKPFDSRVAIMHPNNFYMEREWRRLGNMGFQEQEVRTVIVPARYGNRANTELPAYRGRIRLLEEVVEG